ncbi:MAG: type I DNA topoisomerase [Bacteroidaceae bacterium]|nr:type I DNA topoisomerase [Bacteroidaceae bacterium]
MQNNLVIVESPAKAKTIGKFLGKDYKVMSSYGHIRDLKQKSFSIDTQTFQPEYEIPEDKQKIVESLRNEAKKTGNVWLASDEDREGEAISWHLAEVLNLDVAKTKRIVFHEITQTAIQEAIAHPRNIDLNLVNAQQARRVLDRIVGFKLSPVLWRKVKPSLSAGRVQSVAVRLIADRENEIRNFQATSSYAVIAQFEVVQADGQTNVVKADLNRRFASEEEARDFLERCKDATFSVSRLEKKPVKRSPAPPFMTSTLQQEAVRKLGYPVALTMRLAQQLYEAGLITYMRTDSLNLSSLCLNSSKKLIQETMGEQYSKPRQFHTKAKGAQEAHEAIRPTFMDRETIDGTQQEQKLYQLIRQRTLASQMADATFERTTATIAISGMEETFEANGEVMLFDGFLKVYRESSDDDVENPDTVRLLPPLKKGQELQTQQIIAEERFTQRPARYNEASLVHKMEELGIGRPSTYATIITTIQQRGYVERGNKKGQERSSTQLVMSHGTINKVTKTEVAGAEKNKLLPTDVGMVVNEYLLSEFPDILDYNFTAKVEKDFDAVAEGKKEWTKLMKRFYEKFVPEVDKAIQTKTEHKVGERILGTDPVSGRTVSAKIGPFGPMAQLGNVNDAEKPQFAPLLKGMSLETITLEAALELFKLPRHLGEFEGKEVVVNNGRFGPYVLCDKKYVSIPKTLDVMTISLEEASELIRQKREAEVASHLKTFEEEPEMEVRTGRFGPYIAYQGKNYHLPKNMAANAKDLTLEQCRDIIAKQSETGKRKTVRRTTKKK